MPRGSYAILICLIFSLFSNETLAKKRVYYKIEHDTCRLKILNNFKSDEDKDYKEKVLKLLEDRNYKVSELDAKKKITPGDFHLKFTWQRTGTKVYKDCSAEAVMKSAKSTRARSDDEGVFEMSSKRSLPRLTFSGAERCRRAIDDVFNLLPHCILIKR